MAIIPTATELTRPYWEAAAEHRLVTQRCAACEEIWHPPLPRCPTCHTADLEWHQVSGRGTVYSFTVVHHPTHVALADAVPYVVAIVELAEGPWVISNIRKCAPSDVHIGMAVRVTFERLTDEVTVPQFVPEGS